MWVWSFLITFLCSPKRGHERLLQVWIKTTAWTRWTPIGPCRQGCDSRKMTQWGLSEALFSKCGSRSQMACNACLTWTFLGSVLDILNLSSQCGAWEPAFTQHSRWFWCEPTIENCHLRESAPTPGWFLSGSVTLATRPSVAVLVRSGPGASAARTWNFLGSQGEGGASYGTVSGEGLYPSFKYISVYIVHYFPHKSTSVNHFIFLSIFRNEMRLHRTMFLIKNSLIIVTIVLKHIF